MSYLSLPHRSLIATTLPKRAAKIHLPLATSKISPNRQKLVWALCESYACVADTSHGTEYRIQMEKWCDELLTLNEYAGDVDGLVGHGEALLMKEEWETKDF